MSNPVVVALANQKKGVGKTTTAVHLAAGAAILGKNALVIDFDSQATATNFFGIDSLAEDISKQTIYQVVKDKMEPAVAIMDNVKYKLDVLPSHIDLATLELNYFEKKNWQYMLKEVIESIKKDDRLDYDIIVIDTPPSLGFFTINALVASDWVVIPIKIKENFFAGIVTLCNTIMDVEKKLNTDLKLVGFLRTNVDIENATGRRLLKEAESYDDVDFPLLETYIRSNMGISNAELERRTVYEYSSRATGSKDYLAMTREVLTHIGVAYE